MPWYRREKIVNLLMRTALLLGVFFPGTLVADEPIRIVLTNGATLPMSRAFPVLTWMDHNDHKLLKGSSERHAVFFTVTVFDEGDEDAEQLAEMLKRVLKVSEMQLTPVEEPEQELSRRTLIFRLSGDPAYQDYLVGFVRSRTQEASVVFCIVGPEDGFYQKSQAFWDMLTGYKPGPGSAAGRMIVQPWMVVTAIIVFLLNTVTLWYGFRQMAVARSLELEEGP
ncbi:hypothetical protein [Acanthopleuribacter pedis]|uniref:Transmembrane protein n=1 Tax=Acanthopleuribacter pedis TaxID=442870 RepID=A0A8J7QAF2_9BACT|nr:hypothetical protein [Acanthopleuribacter pedis]MBO1322852.1 hypothetical protein [Acanthopleuribacter pedis]